MLAVFLNALESGEDQRLFTALYEQHRDTMWHIALHILKNSQDAEDAVQSAFLQVIRHFEMVPKIPHERLSFWLASIVKNEAYMLLRKKRPDVPLESWDGPAGNETDGVELLELFDRLPEIYHVVLEMKFLLGCTDREIARKLGISETAVSTRTSRGHALLKKILEKEGLSL